MSASDDADNLDLPAVEPDAVSTGAAADSADWDERLKGLPRLLRYAMLVIDNAGHVEPRLIAEINELCPNLPLNAEWAAALTVDAGLALAAELDRRAATENDPNLRSVADCVRLLSLPMPRGASFFEEHRRVAKALLLAFNKIVHDSDEQLRSDVERFAFGWAALPACSHMMVRHESAAVNAALLGSRMAEHRIAAMQATARRRQEEERQAREEAEKEEAAETLHQVSSSAEAVPDHHLVVARLSSEEMKNVKLREILGPLKSVINVPLPLVEVPPLHQVRNALLFEFPYATEVIDFALADLVGRFTVRLRPLLLVGDPGGGKTRFARRLGEALGLNVWREDASRADGAVFGGTDRRWYSAEPSHPFLAIAAGKIANPLVLIDELEKAGTRSDYGRLWDCLLGFLEPETNSRYPDPALQTNLDLSHVSFVATANRLDPLPSPIRDRFRVVTFPKPSVDDLDALLPAVIADLAKERGLDGSWVLPLDGAQHAAVARHWRGGSVRRLRRIVEAILRERDLRATRN
ncbi:ATP-dependent Lon protease [Bradyrhizobium sp. AZCC 1578]|uniref:AAA family ATPase n=1 Tax=unclassified Bradyrhizobium TaxID=2631580 RepID=UPI002FEF546A